MLKITAEMDESDAEMAAAMEDIAMEDDGMKGEQATTHATAPNGTLGEAENANPQGRREEQATTHATASDGILGAPISTFQEHPACGERVLGSSCQA